MKNKALLDLAALGAAADLLSGGIYSSLHRFSKGGTHRNYRNKNSNIEYYYDEKGNLRRRKLSE